MNFKDFIFLGKKSIDVCRGEWWNQDTFQKKKGFTHFHEICRAMLNFELTQTGTLLPVVCLKNFHDGICGMWPTVSVQIRNIFQADYNAVMVPFIKSLFFKDIWNPITLQQMQLCSLVECLASLATPLGPPNSYLLWVSRNFLLNIYLGSCHVDAFQFHGEVLVHRYLWPHLYC